MDVPVNPTTLVMMVFGAAAGLLLLLYGGLPLLVKFTHRQPLRYRLSPLPMEALRQAGGAQFHLMEDQLRQLGFRPVVASLLGAEVKLGVYRSSVDGCLVALAVKDDGAVVLDFTQPYADGFHLSLTNAPFPTALPEWERKQVYRLPGESDPNRLYQAFNAIRRREKRPPKIITPGFELADLEVFCNDELQQLIRRGFVSARNPERLTFRGAYAMTWPLLPPFKGWLLSRERLRTERAAGFRPA